MVEVGATLVGAHNDSSSGNPKARLLTDGTRMVLASEIKAILATDTALEVAGEAQDIQEAISRCRELRPDMILMDVSMPKMDGIEGTRKIKALFPETSVLILSTHADPQLLMDAVMAGAAGYVLKGDSQNHMLDAIRAVLGGETYLDQKLVMTLLRSLGEEADARGVRPSAVPAAMPATPVAAAPLQKPLTPRETEILGHLARGETNRQIATELHVSLSTVKRHLEHILPKLGVSDRTQAAVKAVEMGLRPPERSG